jgi:hypothetical protein
VKRWWGAVSSRPAVKKAYETVAAARSPATSEVSKDDFNRNMFGEASAKAMAAKT